MAALPALIPRYTVAELELWEDRWELIEGIPHAMSPAPSIRHQLLSQRLTTLLEAALAGCAPCLFLVASNWRIDDDTVVIPDALVVCPERPLEGAYVTETPALVVEILSPSTALKDQTVKRELYAREGVRHYVLVDPEAQTAEVLTLGEEGGYRRRSEGGGAAEAFDLGPCTLSLDLGALWAR